MAHLSISIPVPLGPLSVEVLGARGERVGSRITMSSTMGYISLPSIEPGEYTVVATRPSGEQLVTDTTVGINGGHAKIRTADRSPREFLTEAAQFGLAYPTATKPEDDVRSIALQSPRTSNTAIRSLGVLLHAKGLASGVRMSFGDEAQWIPRTKSGLHQLIQWRFSGRRWHQITNAAPFAVEGSEDFLQIRVQADEPIALGLFDSQGFGPIIVVPPFRFGTDVTFLAAGLEMDANADRVDNPSALRVPVALAMPREAQLADLLVGVTAPVLPDAIRLLEDGRGGTADAALEFLLKKYMDPAAAVLGALFLARFAPSRLPLAWLKTLHSILPEIAETSLLLAWARISQGDGGMQWDQSPKEQLRQASRSQCLFFSRSRFQLSQMARLYGPKPRARQDIVTTPRRARTGDFLDFAADASGLEAFWGAGPTRPARALSSKPLSGGIAVGFDNGRFDSINIHASG